MLAYEYGIHEQGLLGHEQMEAWAEVASIREGIKELELLAHEQEVRTWSKVASIRGRDTRTRVAST